MDDRRRIPGGEGSPRALCDRDSSTVAQDVGSEDADPDDVTEHLRRATKAFLAGDHASARAVFEAILPPIASADIDLGQHELVEEALGVDARACVAQDVVSVYTTTPLRDRADAILRALAQVEGVGTLLSPIKDMEEVSAGVLSDLTAFLPLWVKRLQLGPPDRRPVDRDRRISVSVFDHDRPQVNDLPWKFCGGAEVRRIGPAHQARRERATRSRLPSAQ
jgi:hypothetical protein